MDTLGFNQSRNVFINQAFDPTVAGRAFFQDTYIATAPASTLSLIMPFAAMAVGAAQEMYCNVCGGLFACDWVC